MEILRSIKQAVICATVMTGVVYLIAQFYDMSSLVSLCIGAGVSFLSYALVAIYLNKTAITRLIKQRLEAPERNFIEPL